jgi:arylsulfatase B
MRHAVAERVSCAMPRRRKNHAMVAFMDESVGKITAALTQRGMWNRTLLVWMQRADSSYLAPTNWSDCSQVWSADNGGAVHLGGGANAFPLRGGYENNWEGCVSTCFLTHSRAPHTGS